MCNSSEDLFYRVKPKIDLFLDQVAEFIDKPLEDITFTDCKQYCVEKCDFEFHSFGNLPVVSKVLSACIHLTDCGPIVLYDSKTNPARLNFSLAHEVSHYILDHQQYGGQVLPQLIDSKGYTEDDLTIEREANFGASMLLLNDVALQRRIEEVISFHALSIRYGISYQALRIRLLNFLVFNYNFSYNTAKKTVALYEDGELDLDTIIKSAYYDY